MKSYRELETWQKAYALVLEVYRYTRGFPQDELFGLTAQMRRAAVSVPANVAEGYCRSSRAEYLRFLGIARGSAGELGTLVSLAHDLGYLAPDQAKQLSQLVDDVGKLLRRLAESLQRTA